MPNDEKEHSKAVSNNQENTGINYLPLEVYFHNGAAYSQQYYVSKMVANN